MGASSERQQPPYQDRTDPSDRTDQAGAPERVGQTPAGRTRPDPHSSQADQPGPRQPSPGPADRQPRTLSWAAMLAWIALAFSIAGLVAYRLVTPFFPKH